MSGSGWCPRGSYRRPLREPWAETQRAAGPPPCHPALAPSHPPSACLRPSLLAWTASTSSSCPLSSERRGDLETLRLPVAAHPPLASASTPAPGHRPLTGPPTCQLPRATWSQLKTFPSWSSSQTRQSLCLHPTSGVLGPVGTGRTCLGHPGSVWGRKARMNEGCTGPWLRVLAPTVLGALQPTPIALGIFRYFLINSKYVTF